MGIRELFRRPLFWLAVCLMVCSGASELAMAQWASAYAEAALGLSKAAGNLGGSIGPGIVGRVTQNAGDNIRTGMGVGLVFPLVLLLMLFILARAKTGK